MEKPHEVDDLIAKAEEYAKTSYDLSKLKLTDKSSSAISQLLATVAGSAILFISIMLASFGLAVVIGRELNKMEYGFFIVAAGYMVLAVFFYFFIHGGLKAKLDKYLKHQLFT